MDLKVIRYFRAVAEQGNFSRAATCLRVAQPALSRMIQKLEHDLKVELFTRSSRGVTLTVAGSVLLERTARFEREIEQVRRSMALFAQGVTGDVRLGMQAPLSILLAPSLVKAYRQRHPGVDLKILEAGSGDITERLLAEQLDIAIVDPPWHDHADLVTLPLWSENLYLTGPREGVGGVPFPSGPVTPELIQTLPVVMSSARHALRRLVDAAFARAQCRFQPIIEAEGPLTIVSMVRAGIGYSLLPRIALYAEADSGELRMEAVTPPIRRTVSIVMRQASRTEPAVASLVHLLSTHAARLADHPVHGGMALYQPDRCRAAAELDAGHRPDGRAAAHHGEQQQGADRPDRADAGDDLAE